VDGLVGCDQRGRYRFQHALYHQVLYESLGTVRRVQLHPHIGARQEVGETLQLFRVLGGLIQFQRTQAQLGVVEALSLQFFHMAQQLTVRERIIPV